MSWFPVDDGFHSHPKVLATSLAARGLWVTAGSWCSSHPTNGVLPSHVLVSLGGTPALAEELRAAGMWRRTRKGCYAFHDWFDWGTKRTAEEQLALSEIRAANGRKGGLARASKNRAKAEANAGLLGSKPAVDNSTPGHDTTSDQRKQASKTEANAKQVASGGLGGGLKPKDHKDFPLTPAAAAAGEHHGQHPNCRHCGTNPRGRPPPSEAARHPSARPASETLQASGRPARGKVVQGYAEQARQAITKDPP